MLTDTATAAATTHKGKGAQKVVIVNGSTEILELLETVLDAGHYDVVFVESASHAYSQVKRVQPNLVVLSLRMDDLESFRVLSMLKLDPETSEIPVLTYASEVERDPSEEPDDEETSDGQMFAAVKPAPSMN
jgi:PleD family two-component response regulator